MLSFLPDLASVVVQVLATSVYLAGTGVTAVGSGLSLGSSAVEGLGRSLTVSTCSLCFAKKKTIYIYHWNIVLWRCFFFIHSNGLGFVRVFAWSRRSSFIICIFCVELCSDGQLWLWYGPRPILLRSALGYQNYMKINWEITNQCMKNKNSL